jgi:hypothetical protein
MRLVQLLPVAVVVVGWGLLAQTPLQAALLPGMAVQVLPRPSQARRFIMAVVVAVVGTTHLPLPAGMVVPVAVGAAL